MSADQNIDRLYKQMLDQSRDDGSAHKDSFKSNQSFVARSPAIAWQDKAATMIELKDDKTIRER